MKKYFFVVLLLSATLLMAETIYVYSANSGYEDGTSDYPWNTIQEGIDQALTLNGYVTIEVREGTYNEININLTSSNLTHLSLIGVDGAEDCIIDGGNTGRVIDVLYSSNTEKFITITEFTIKNSITSEGIIVRTGNGTSRPLNVEISDNIIQDCHNGIRLLYVNDCLVKDNTIINYSQINISWGIVSNNINNLTIDGNFISNYKNNISFLSTDGKVINNEIEVVYDGETEGVHLQADSNVDIINNLILIYPGTTSSYKRGIYNLSGNVKIINNTIIGFGDNTTGYKNFSTAPTEKFVNNIMWNLETNISAYTPDFEVNYCCYNGTIPSVFEPDPLENHNIVGINPELTTDHHLSEDSILLIDGGDPDTDGDDDDWEIDEDDRDIDGSRKDMGSYPYFHEYDTKHFSPGWQWVSFPVLDQLEGEMYEQAYYENDDPGLLQETYQGDPNIDGFLRIDGKDKYITYDEEDGFIPFDFGNMLFRHEGYKVEVISGAPASYIEADGERLPADHTIDGALNSGEYHWLGFWIQRTQNMIESFGDFWENVKKVKSEDWFYSPAIIQRGDPNPLYPIVLKPDNLTLEYGKTYLVLFNETVRDFHWTSSITVEEAKKKSEPENFTYTEKADYEAIDVFNIPPGVTEIGVFEDDVCIGAVVVEDSCAQILAYSDNANRDPIPFTFEVVTGRGFSTQVKDYQVLDWETGEFESRSIFSDRQEYSVIRFGDEDEPEDNILLTPQLYGNYPNPFNPTTTISFSLVQTSQFVTLEVFNIKGQKVKTLYKGIAEEGKHSVTWEGKDTNGKSVGTGIYFYKLKTGKKEISRKMLLLK